MSRRARLVVAIAALSCHGAHPPPPPPPAPPAAAMLGRWEYVDPAARRRPTDGPGLGAGLIVALEFDSASGRSFYGRVTSWLAGDLGLAATMFGRIAGRLSDSATVSFTIPLARGGSADVFVEGVLKGDTLAIKTARRGAEPGPFARGGRFVRVRRQLRGTAPGVPTASLTARSP